MRLVPVGREHRELDESVDATVEFDSVEVGDAQRALDDRCAGQPLLDIALAKSTNYRVGVAQQQRIVDYCPAVRRDRSGDRSEAAGGTATPLSLSDEFELLVRPPSDHTQKV